MESYSQERRSPGWRRKDPSGGGKIRLGDFPIPRRGGHWAGDFPIPRRDCHWAGGGKIRLMEILIPRRGGRWAGVSWKFLMEILIPRRGGHWAEVERPVSEIRLGSREKKNSQRRSPSKKMIRARVESSPRSPSFRAAAPLPIELWILASPAQRLQCQRASPADRLTGG